MKHYQHGYFLKNHLIIFLPCLKILTASWLMTNTVDFILLGLLTLPVSLSGFLSHDFHSAQFIESIDFYSSWLSPRMMNSSSSQQLTSSQSDFSSSTLFLCLTESYIFFQIQLASSFRSTTIWLFWLRGI